MPKKVDPVAQRLSLAKAGLAVIAAEGLEAATLRRIAAHAGCTTGTVTHYFPDRSALLRAALDAACQTTARRMYQSALDAPTHLEKFEALLREAVPLDDERRAEARVWLAFWGAASEDPALIAVHERRMADWRGLIRAVLLPLLNPKADVDHEVLTLCALVDGLCVRGALCPENAAEKHARAAEIERVLDFHVSEMKRKFRKDLA